MAWKYYSSAESLHGVYASSAHMFVKIMMSVARMWITVTRPMVFAPTFKVPSLVPVQVGSSYKVTDGHVQVKITIHNVLLKHTKSTNTGGKKTMLTSQPIYIHCPEDIDECDEDISGCNQVCTNQDGSYVCSCYSGYRLDDNQHSCIGQWG